MSLRRNKRRILIPNQSSGMPLPLVTKRGQLLNGHTNQRILQDVRGAFSGDWRNELDKDRFGWPIPDELQSNCIFDWADGDGLTPATGPSLTASGTVTSGQDTSLVGVNGDRITQSFFGPGDLSTPASISITGEDIVMIGLVDIRNMHLAGSRYLCRFYSLSAGAGDPYAGIYFTASNVYIAICRGSGAGSPFYATKSSMASGLNFVVAKFDQSARMDCYCGGNKGSSVNALGMSSVADGVIYLAVNAANRTLHMHRMMVFQGANIADIITDSVEKKLRNTVLGIGSFTEDQPTFERDSQGCTLRNSKYYLLGVDCPSVGDDEGIEFQPECTQKVYNNINPQNTTGWSETSGGAITFTQADDSTELAAASDDLSEFGPNVFHIANSTGSTEYIYSDNTLGNTNAHSLSCFARIVSGSANLGLRDASAGTFSDGTAISGSYARTTNENITPPDSDCALCLEIPDGFEGYVILPQAEEFWCCTAPIPNYSTAATATRNSHGLTIPSLDDSQGRIEFDFKSIVTGNVGSISYLVSSGLFFISTNVIRCSDGSTNVDSAVNVMDGSSHHVSMSWYGSTRILQVDDETPVTGAYDGSWNPTVQFGRTSTHPCQIKNLKVSRNP